MTNQQLPAGIEADDEIALDYQVDGDGNIRIEAKLGGVILTVEYPDESLELVPWLLASSPQILEAVYAQMELAEIEQTDDNQEDQE